MSEIKYFQEYWFYHGRGDGDWPDLTMVIRTIDSYYLDVELREVASASGPGPNPVFDWEVIKSFSLKWDGCSNAHQEEGCIHHCRNASRVAALECEIAAYLTASGILAQVHPDYHDFDGLEVPRSVRVEPQGEQLVLRVES